MVVRSTEVQNRKYFTLKNISKMSQQLVSTDPESQVFRRYYSDKITTLLIHFLWSPRII